MTIEDLKAHLLRLPLDLRSEIARLLMDSLEDVFFGANYDAEFAQELERRFEEIQNGTAVGIPANEVFAELRARYE